MSEPDLMLRAVQLIDDPTVPRDPEKREIILDALREHPVSLPTFIAQMEKRIAASRDVTDHR